MTTEIKITMATIDDLPAMIEVGDQLFDNPVKPERAREFLNDPRHHIAVAYHEDLMVGLVSGLVYVHPDKDPELFVIEASVKDEYRGQEIGPKLTKFLCSYAKEHGVHQAWVLTEKTNDAARRAYSKAGGREDAEPIVMIEFS